MEARLNEARVAADRENACPNIVTLVTNFIEDARGYQGRQEDVLSLAFSLFHIQQHSAIFSEVNMSIFRFLNKPLINPTIEKTFDEILQDGFTRARNHLSSLKESGELSADADTILARKLNAIRLDEWQERALALPFTPTVSRKDFHELLEERANYLKNFSADSSQATEKDDPTTSDSSIIDDALLFSLIVYSCVTRRLLASQIEMFNDPLGSVEPVRIRAKLLRQTTWNYELMDNDSIPLKMYSKWISFQSDLNKLIVFKFPRPVTITNVSLERNEENIELHGFYKASDKAYGVCIYLRSLIETDRWEARLFCANSRVKPFRMIASEIPKLEFYAAELLCELMSKFKLNLNIGKCYYWSDSTDFLKKKKNPCNETKKNIKKMPKPIEKACDHQEWRYVPSCDNPAKIVSEGASPQSLETNSLWWSGPAWLAMNANNWPDSNQPIIDFKEE